MNATMKEYIVLQKEEVLKINPHEISSVLKSEQNLVILNKDGSKYIIEDFFLVDDNILIIEDNGERYQAYLDVKSEDPQLLFDKIGEIDEQGIWQEANGQWYALALGTAIVGAGIGIFSSGGSSSDSVRKESDSEKPTEIENDKAIIEKELKNKIAEIKETINSTIKSIDDTQKNSEIALKSQMTSDLDKAKNSYDESVKLLNEIESLQDVLIDLIKQGELLGPNSDLLQEAKELLALNTDDLHEQLALLNNKLNELSKILSLDDKLTDTDTAIDDLDDNASAEEKAAIEAQLSDIVASLTALLDDAAALAKAAQTAAENARESGDEASLSAAEAALAAAQAALAAIDSAQATLAELLAKAAEKGVTLPQADEMMADLTEALAQAKAVLDDAQNILDKLAEHEDDPVLIEAIETAMAEFEAQLINAQNKGANTDNIISKLQETQSLSSEKIADAKTALDDFIHAIEKATNLDEDVMKALAIAEKGDVTTKTLSGYISMEQDLAAQLLQLTQLSENLLQQLQKVESSVIADDLATALDNLDTDNKTSVDAFNHTLKQAIDNNAELIHTLTEKAQASLTLANALASKESDSAEYQQLLQEVNNSIAQSEDLYDSANNNTAILQRAVLQAMDKGLSPEQNAEFKEYIANIKYFEQALSSAETTIAKAKNLIPDETLPDYEGDDINQLIDDLQDKFANKDVSAINHILPTIDALIDEQQKAIDSALDVAQNAYEKAKKSPTAKNVKALDNAIEHVQDLINKAELNLSELASTLKDIALLDGVDKALTDELITKLDAANKDIDTAQNQLNALSLSDSDAKALNEKADDAIDAIEKIAKDPSVENIDEAQGKLAIFKNSLNNAINNAKTLSDEALIAAKHAEKVPTAENILSAEKKLAKALAAENQLEEATERYKDVTDEITSSITNGDLKEQLLKPFDGIDLQLQTSFDKVVEQNEITSGLITTAKDNLLTEEDILAAYNSAKDLLNDSEALVKLAVEKSVEAKESTVAITPNEVKDIEKSVLDAIASLNNAKKAISHAEHSGVPNYLLDQLTKYYNSLDNKLDYPKGVLQEIDLHARMDLSMECLKTASGEYNKAKVLLEKDPSAVINDPSEFLALVAQANAYLAEGQDRAAKAKELGLKANDIEYLNSTLYETSEEKIALLNEFHGLLGEKAFADLDETLILLQESVYSARINLDKSTLTNHDVFEEQYKTAIRALNDAKLLSEDYANKGVKEIKLAYYNYQIDEFTKEIEAFSIAWNNITQLSDVTQSSYIEAKSLANITSASEKYTAVHQLADELSFAYELVGESILSGAPLEMIQANLAKLNMAVEKLAIEDPVLAAEILIENAVAETQYIENLIKAAETQEQKDLLYDSLYAQLQTANKVMTDAKLSGTISKIKLAELQEDYSNALTALKMYDPYLSTGEKTQAPGNLSITVTDDGKVHIESDQLVDGAVFTLGGKDLPWYSAWLGNISGTVDKEFGSGTVHTPVKGTKYVDIYVDKETAAHIKSSENLSYLYGSQRELGKDVSDLSRSFEVKNSARAKELEAYITDDHTIVITGDNIAIGDSFTLYHVQKTLGIPSYSEVAKGHVTLHEGKLVGVVTEYSKGHSWATVKDFGNTDNLSIDRTGVGENTSIIKSSSFGKKESPAEKASGLGGKADITTKDVTAWVDNDKHLYLKSTKFELGQHVKVYDYFDREIPAGTGVVKLVNGQKVVEIKGIATEQYPELKWISVDIAYDGGKWSTIEKDGSLLSVNFLSVQGNVNSNTQEPPKDGDNHDGIRFDDIDIQPSAPSEMNKGANKDAQDKSVENKQASQSMDDGQETEVNDESLIDVQDATVEPMQEETIVEAQDVKNDESLLSLSNLIQLGEKVTAEHLDKPSLVNFNKLPIMDELLSDNQETHINLDKVVPLSHADIAMPQNAVVNHTIAGESNEPLQLATLLADEDMGTTHNI